MANGQQRASARPQCGEDHQEVARNQWRLFGEDVGKISEHVGEKMGKLVTFASKDVFLGFEFGNKMIIAI